MTMTREQVAAVQADAEAMRQAVSGEHIEGTFHAANWSDKPHRVLYDALKHIDDLARQLLAAMDRLADADMAQAALVQELRQFVTDSYQCGCMDAGCAGRHAERNSTLEALSETLDTLAPGAGVKDLAALRAEMGALKSAVEGLVAVLDRNERKGPIPDVEMMFCWLAAQDVRAAFRKIAQKGAMT